MPWLPGDVAARTPPADPYAAAAALGAFVAALHRPAPPDAPNNPVRGIPLAARDGRFRVDLARLAGVIDTSAAAQQWNELMATPVWAGPPLWLHGDLHPANVLVETGQVSGVVDFGDIAAGDPATDLIIAWMLLPPDARPIFRAATEVDDDTWARGRGWALALAVAIAANSADHPPLAGVARRTLAMLLVSRTLQ